MKFSARFDFDTVLETITCVPVNVGAENAHIPSNILTAVYTQILDKYVNLLNAALCNKVDSAHILQEVQTARSTIFVLEKFINSLEIGK